MEQGNYPIYVLHHAGEAINSANTVYTHVENSTRVVTGNGKNRENTEALAPRTAFNRVANSSVGKTTTSTTTQDLNAVKSKVKDHVDNLTYYPMTQNRGIKLVDVYNNKASMGDFISQMNVQALSDITTAAKDYLGSNGVPNRTELIGGTTQILRDLGISTACNNDGPAGMRANFHSTQAPDGTMLAATFNNELIEKLYKQIGHEMIEAGSDELLGPGMDIHRDPLCGRNFEYFSEDPLLTGMMASYVVRGLQSEGIAATPKHFAANNQEANRHGIDDQISERSLREIHLRAFEIMTKQSKPLNIMTSYNAFNGAHTHSSFELINEVLRDQWG
jgi:beta-glucosidase